MTGTVPTLKAAIVCQKATAISEETYILEGVGAHRGRLPVMPTREKPLKIGLSLYVELLADGLRIQDSLFISIINPDGTEPTRIEQPVVFTGEKFGVRSALIDLVLDCSRCGYFYFELFFGDAPLIIFPFHVEPPA